MAIRTAVKNRLYSSFGARLKQIRLEKGIAPLQFYRKSGIDPVTLRKYEKGELEPKLSIIMIIAKAFKISHLEVMNISFKARELNDL
jgi:transcriptional regulator with XRE-family HTH domain